jgi:hypothetical protein
MNLVREEPVLLHVPDNGHDDNVPGSKIPDTVDDLSDHLTIHRLRGSVHLCREVAKAIERLRPAEPQGVRKTIERLPLCGACVFGYAPDRPNSVATQRLGDALALEELWETRTSKRHEIGRDTRD